MIPLLFFTVGLPFWLLVTLVFLGSLLDAPGRSARKALYPRLVTLAGTALERATSAYDGADRAGLLLGGPIAGALIAFIGPANVLWVNAATFVVSAVLTFVAVPTDPLPGTASQPLALRAYLSEVREGLSFIAAEPLVRVTVVVMLLLNAIDGTTVVIAPVYADQFLGGAADLGLLMGGLGLGAFGGTVAFGVVGHRLARRAVFVAGFLLLGSRFIAFALGGELLVLLAVMLIAGLGAGPINPIMDALLYERVPEQLRGRVFATISAATLTAVPAGTIAAGYLAEVLPIRTVFAAFAVPYLLIASTPIWSGPWRRQGTSS
jgi:predicted MFS family arabinose efflux permease